MRVFRSILLSENEKLEKENLGISWTLCEEFAEFHANDINKGSNRKFVILETEISESMIDWNETLFAMEERANEYEVVLNPTSNLQIAIHQYSEIEMDDFVGSTGNGNDFEDYLGNGRKYEGTLTRDDFLSVANEF